MYFIPDWKEHTENHATINKNFVDFSFFFDGFENFILTENLINFKYQSVLGDREKIKLLENVYPFFIPSPFVYRYFSLILFNFIDGHFIRLLINSMMFCDIGKIR